MGCREVILDCHVAKLAHYSDFGPALGRVILEHLHDSAREKRRAVRRLLVIVRVRHHGEPEATAVQSVAHRGVRLITAACASNDPVESCAKYNIGEVTHREDPQS